MALEYFSQRYAELSSDLSNAVDVPAVRLLVVSNKPALAERPVIVTSTAGAQPGTLIDPVNILGNLAASLRKAAEDLNRLSSPVDALGNSSEAADYDKADEVLRGIRHEIEEATLAIAARRKQQSVVILRSASPTDCQRMTH